MPIDIQHPQHDAIWTALATVIDPAVVLVRWLLNGTVIADAAPQLLSIEPLRLSPGLYTITVHAYEPTD